MTEKKIQPDQEPAKEQDPAQEDYENALELLKNGELAQAANIFHNALIGFEQNANQKGIANASDKLGEICLERGDYETAFKHLDRAYAICDQEEDGFSLIVLNKKIARAKQGLKEFDAAIKIYLDLLDTYEGYNNPAGAVEILELLAATYLEKDDRAKAADTCRAAAFIHKSFKHSRHAQALLDKADAIEAGE